MVSSRMEEVAGVEGLPGAVEPTETPPGVVMVVCACFAPRETQPRHPAKRPTDTTKTSTHAQPAEGVVDKRDRVLGEKVMLEGSGKEEDLVELGGGDGEVDRGGGKKLVGAGDVTGLFPFGDGVFAGILVGNRVDKCGDC